jgi:hypothetical protein
MNYVLHIFESRRDGTLLTVDFNLRTGQGEQRAPSAPSPAGTALSVSALRDLAVVVYLHHRMLKHTVNKGLSLRDKTPNGDFPLLGETRKLFKKPLPY